MRLLEGGNGDFKVMVAGRTVLDKNLDASDFTSLHNGGKEDLCPEGQPKPFPSPSAAMKVSTAITEAAQARAAGCDGDACSKSTRESTTHTGPGLRSFPWLPVVLIGLAIGLAAGRHLARPS